MHLSAGKNKNDRLTAYDGTAITYDEIGNPITIGDMSLTWEGRQLKEFSVPALYTCQYTYNADGIRTSKTIDGAVHSYVLDGSRIVSETINSAYIFIYLYDEAGSPIGIKFRRANYAAGAYDYYFFEKNLQGDIVAIYNESGTKVATYTYDAWGKVITTLESGAVGLDGYVANNNPFRYRGYYYDTETGWYYLQSRYYNPTWGRFLNADGYVSTGQDLTGNNMFVYCSNNPVFKLDSSGMFWKEIGDWFCNAYEAVTEWIDDTSKQIDDAVEWLNENALNKDGSYSLYDNDRFEDRNSWHDQIFVVTPSTSAIGGSLEADFVTGGWEGKYVDFSLFDFGHAEASASINGKGVSFGAMASIWSPSIAFSVGKITVELGAEVGSIGAFQKKGEKSVSFGVSASIGGMFSISWE